MENDNELEDRIRRKAHELWEAEGRPEGREEFHWDEAREIIALQDVGGPPLVDLAETLEEPVEPVEAFENQGEFPGLTDQGEEQPGPCYAALTEEADERPLSVEPVGSSRQTARRRRSPS
jgi:hypothetical protein